MSRKVSRCLVAGAVAGLVLMAGAASAGTPSPSLNLNYTVSASDLDPMTCATDHIISVQPGDQVKFCYEVTNTGDVTFNFHDLFDTRPGAGQLLSNFPLALAPTASTFITRLATVGSSQINSATWSARDVQPGYGFLTSSDTGGPVFAFEDISTTGAALNLTDDGEGNATIPFPFTFYGVTGTTLRVGNNGGIIFAATGDLGFSNIALPDVAAPPLKMYPFWDDLDDEAGNVYFEVRGVAPNRRAIVQWHNRPHFNGATNPTNTITFQVILTEGSPNILFQYLDVNFGVVANPEWDNGASATVGLNQSASSANQFSFNTASLQNNFAILWAPSAAPQSASDTDLAAVRVRAAELTLDQTEIESSVFVGQTSTDTLNIGNAGDDPLTWSLTEAPAGENDHIPAQRRITWPASAASVPASMQGDPRAAATLSEAKAAPAAPAPTSRSGIASLALGGGATAYAAKIFPAPVQLVSFNTDTPATTTPIGAALTQSFFAGAFSGSDFSKLYAIDGGSASPTLNQLFSVNTATGVATFIAASAPQAGDTWTGMSFDPTTGTMYASAAGGTPISSRLYTLNTATGVATVVGSSGAGIVIDIAINASGQVFGVDISTDSLVAINKTTGAAAVIGALGIDANFAQGLAFDKAADVLYWAAYQTAPGGQLYTVNTATGAATLVDNLAGNGEFDAFDIATAAGPCSEPEDIPWLDVAPTSGTIAAGAPDTEVTLTYDASGLAVGSYSANLCLNSNDPERAFVRIPVELTVDPLPDLIFRNGFDSTGGTPGIYTDRATFLLNTQSGFFENDFASVGAGASDPIPFTGGGFAYTVAASAGQLFNDPGVISTDQAVDSIVVTFTGNPVTAIGGNFWATDIAVQPTGTAITLTLSDATTVTYTSTGPTDFRGFVSLVPITSITIEAPDDGGPRWSTLDNLVVGTR